MNRCNREVEKLLEKEDEVRAVLRCEVEGKSTMKDGAGVEWCRDRRTGRWWWRDQNGTWQSRSHRYTPPRPSEASDAASEAPSDAPSQKSRCSSVSTTATLSMPLVLTFDEEMEARKMEKELAKIAVLQQRKANGEPLTKSEESAIRRKAEFYMAQAMVKLRSGAARMTLSLDEEKEARKIERELADIASLQEQKEEIEIDGEIETVDGVEWCCDRRGRWWWSDQNGMWHRHLNKAQVAKVGRKAEFEKAPVMVKVKFGALRCPLEHEKRSKQKAVAPVASKAPCHSPAKEAAPAVASAPVSASAPDPWIAPVSACVPDSPSLPMPARLAPMSTAASPAFLAQLG